MLYESAREGGVAMAQPFERPMPLPDVLGWHPEWFTDRFPSGGFGTLGGTS